MPRCKRQPTRRQLCLLSVTLPQHQNQTRYHKLYQTTVYLNIYIKYMYVNVYYFVNKSIRELVAWIFPRVVQHKKHNKEHTKTRETRNSATRHLSIGNTGVKRYRKREKREKHDRTIENYIKQIFNIYLTIPFSFDLTKNWSSYIAHHDQWITSYRFWKVERRGLWLETGSRAILVVSERVGVEDGLWNSGFDGTWQVGKCLASLKAPSRCKIIIINQGTYHDQEIVEILYKL